MAARRTTKTDTDDATPVEVSASLITSESERVASRATGRAAGDRADKTYYLSDGKVTTTQPEEAVVIVAEGDVVSGPAAELIKGSR